MLFLSYAACLPGTGGQRGRVALACGSRCGIDETGRPGGTGWPAGKGAAAAACGAPFTPRTPWRERPSARACPWQRS
eukprot:scaffold26273_cov67-Isochrysis_galbana.AAC.1